MILSDEFTPWFGVIEDVNDPLESGRYKVRVYGYNTDNKGLLPTSMLKWFRAGSNNSAQLNGVGQSVTGYVVGSLVFGYYIDKDKQDGIIVMAFPGDSDMSLIARGKDSSYEAALKSGVVKNIPDARGESWSEPTSKYQPQYPKNKVFQTESGHVVEYDDTPGSERITIFHKSGTFEETHPDGIKVEHNTSDSFSINLGGKFVFVDGNINLVAGGDYRLSANGEVYIKARNIVLDSAVVDVYGVSNAIDHISSNVSGMTHIHGGVFPGPATTSTPLGAVTTFAPTPANNFFISAEDTGYTPESLSYAVEQGFMTQQEADEILTATPIIDSVDTEPTVTSQPILSECGISVSDRVDYNTQLSDNFILRDVSIGAVVSQYTIVDQAGIKKQDIICNLKNLSFNVLERIYTVYPNLIITSAFRHGDGTSQHHLGQAVDIQFKNVTKSFYYDVAKWIKNNVPYDQLILEYQSREGSFPWIHISLKPERNQRGQVLTMFNHKVVQSGLVKLQ